MGARDAAIGGAQQAGDHRVLLERHPCRGEGGGHGQHGVGVDAVAEALGHDGPAHRMAGALGDEPAAVVIADKGDAETLHILGQGAAVVGALGDQVAIANPAAGGDPVGDEQFGAVGGLLRQLPTALEPVMKTGLGSGVVGSLEQS